MQEEARGPPFCCFTTASITDFKEGERIGTYQRFPSADHTIMLALSSAGAFSAHVLSKVLLAAEQPVS